MSVRTGPLDGVVVVEFEAIGPVPFASGLLVDMGATVVRIARPSGPASRLPSSLMATAEPSGDVVAIDLKTDVGRDQALALLSDADVLIEGFRPGTLERLGLGPDAALDANRRLVYARVTGWGQDGEYASMAGHDINYIGLAGALATIGPRDRPIPPLNLVGDYGGGGMFAVAGILAALVERSHTGLGQVIDIAMVFVTRSRSEWQEIFDGTDACVTPVLSLSEVGAHPHNAERRAVVHGNNGDRPAPAPRFGKPL